MLDKDSEKYISNLPYKKKFNLDGTHYQEIQKIGFGAYGVVCSAQHTVSKEKVAIKKIPHVFKHFITAKRTLREIKILRHLCHQNVISISDIFAPVEAEFNEIYVVLDLMESDLHRILSSSQPISEDHIKYFMYQLLCGLKYIHSAEIAHRDLKPSNLLINSNCKLKIGDFGMSRHLPTMSAQEAQGQVALPTQYVATRWYRAPEIIMGHLQYCSSVDIWSCGCILAEMLLRKALFPGRNPLHQIQLICGALGPPPDAFLEAIVSETIRGTVEAIQVEESASIDVMLSNAPRKALDLVKKLLQYEPQSRLTAEKALAHLYLNKYRDLKLETTCTNPVDLSFEHTLVGLTELENAIRKEMTISCSQGLFVDTKSSFLSNISSSSISLIISSTSSDSSAKRPPSKCIERSKYFKHCSSSGQPKTTICEDTKSLLKMAIAKRESQEPVGMGIQAIRKLKREQKKASKAKRLRKGPVREHSQCNSSVSNRTSTSSGDCLSCEDVEKLAKWADISTNKQNDSNEASATVEPHDKLLVGIPDKLWGPEKLAKWASDVEQQLSAGMSHLAVSAQLPAPLHTPQSSGLGYGLHMTDLEVEELFPMLHQPGSEWAPPNSAELLSDLLDLYEGNVDMPSAKV